MSLIRWDDKYLVGNEVIDHDHKAVEVDQCVECLVTLQTYSLSENDNIRNSDCSLRLADSGADQIKSHPIETVNAAD